MECYTLFFCKLILTGEAGTQTCGDGLCLERFPESCFDDCYTEITKSCSPIAVPPGHISPGRQRVNFRLVY